MYIYCINTYHHGPSWPIMARITIFLENRLLCYHEHFDHTFCNLYVKLESLLSKFPVEVTNVYNTFTMHLSGKTKTTCQGMSQTNDLRYPINMFIQFLSKPYRNR